MALRVCDVCGKIDDLGRHVLVVAPGEIDDAPSKVYNAVLNSKASNEDKLAAMESLKNDTLQIRHISCCAAEGCPTGTCQAPETVPDTP